MSEAFDINLIQTIGTPMGMLSFFVVLAWRYLKYQTARDEKRESMQEEHRDKQEARINELVNGDRALMLTRIGESNEILKANTTALNHLSDMMGKTIGKLHCTMKEE